MELLQSIGFLDIIFVTILVISAVIGLIRGAVREVMSLVGLVAAVYFAFKFSDTLSKSYVSKVFEDPQVSYIVAFVLIIILTLFAIAIISSLANKLLSASGLSFVNRFLGLLFGLVRGSIINTILVLIIGFIPGVSNEGWWKQSKLAPIFRNLAQQASGQLPKDLSTYLDSGKKTLNAVGETVLQIDLDKGAEKTPKTGKENSDIDKILESIQDSNKEAGSEIKIQLESTKPVQTPTTELPEHKAKQTGKAQAQPIKIELESTQ